MSEIILKYKGSKAFKAILSLAKRWDIEVQSPIEKNADEEDKSQYSLPISFSKYPNVNALSGIWAGNPKSLDEIRKQAWGFSYMIA